MSSRSPTSNIPFQASCSPLTRLRPGHVSFGRITAAISETRISSPSKLAVSSG